MILVVLMVLVVNCVVVVVVVNDVVPVTDVIMIFHMSRPQESGYMQATYKKRKHVKKHTI